MRIVVESFRGEAPRVTPRALPDNASTGATNARLLTGDVTAWGRFAEAAPTYRAAGVETIHLMAPGIWLTFSGDVDVARGIIPGDETYRTYLTGAQFTRPQFTNYALATGGAQPWPATTRPLGVPAPVGAPTVEEGIDPNPSTYSIDVLDEGDSLATNWVANPVLNWSGRFAEVTQATSGGNPGDCYEVRYDENRDPGQEAWAYRDFGVGGATVLTVSAQFKVTDQFFQAAIQVGCTPQGAGIRVVYFNSRLRIVKASEWGAIFGGAELATVAASPAPAYGVWNRIDVSVTRQNSGQKTVVAALYSPADVLLARVTANGTFEDGGCCGFANGINQDSGSRFLTRYDNFQVRAVAPTNYTPVDTATSYVYTYVNDLGEESAPSYASTTVLRPDGVAITVTTPADLPSSIDASWNITSKRIYRSATGATGSAFLFVAEVPLWQEEYVDAVPDTELGPPLESQDWDLPPTDLRGIIALPNGVMAGFRANELCLSAQNRPHAWPVANRLTTDTRIVGIGNIDTTVVVGTESFPYVASGNDPAAYSMAKFEVPQACVSKRSIAYLTGLGVVFASPDGLLAVSGVGQIRNLTDGVFTRDQWQALNPESIIGVAHDDVYHFFYEDVWVCRLVASTPFDFAAEGYVWGDNFEGVNGTLLRDHTPTFGGGSTTWDAAGSDIPPLELLNGTAAGGQSNLSVTPVYDFAPPESVLYGDIMRVEFGVFSLPTAPGSYVLSEVAFARDYGDRYVYVTAAAEGGISVSAGERGEGSTIICNIEGVSICEWHVLEIRGPLGPVESSAGYRFDGGGWTPAIGFGYFPFAGATSMSASVRQGLVGSAEPFDIGSGIRIRSVGYKLGLAPE